MLSLFNRFPHCLLTWDGCGLRRNSFCGVSAVGSGDSFSADCFFSGTEAVSGVVFGSSYEDSISCSNHGLSLSSEKLTGDAVLGTKALVSITVGISALAGNFPVCAVSRPHKAAQRGTHGVCDDCCNLKELAHAGRLSIAKTCVCFLTSLSAR